MANADVLIRILGDRGDFDSKLQGAETQAKLSAGNIGKAFAKTGAALTASVTAPLVLGFNQAVGAATDFNAAMANVGTLIPGQRDRVNELADAVTRLSTETGKSTGDLAAGLYDVISAFGDTADTALILEANAKAASAGLSTTQEAIALTSAVTKAYGDTSAAAVVQVSDLAFQAVTLGQTTFPELAGSIGKVTPSAVAMGVSMQELFGFMATFTGVTGKAAEVSTQLNGVLTALLKPTDEMEAALKAIGFESGQAAIKQLGLKGTMDALYTATGQNQTAFGALFGNVEALRIAFPATSTQAETLGTKIAAMGKSAGLTDVAFKEQTDGVNAAGYAMNQARIAVDNIWKSLGEALLPAVIAITPLIKSLATAVQDGVTWFSGLPDPIKNAVIALGAMLAAAGPVLGIIGAILLLPISGTMVAWAGAIAGVVAGITLAWSESETFRTILMDLWQQVVSTAKEIWTLATTIGVLVAQFVDGHPQLMNFLGFLYDVVAQIVAWVAKLGQLLSPLGILEKTIKSINDVLKPFVGNQKDAAKEIKGATAEIKKQATETKKTDTAVAKALRTMQELADAAGTKRNGLASSLKDATDRTKDLKDGKRDLEAQLSKTRAEIEKTKDELLKLGAALTVNKEMNDLADAAQNLNDRLIAQQSEMANLSSISVPGIITEIENAQLSVAGLGDEFGVFSTDAKTELGNTETNLKGWVSSAGGQASKFKTDFTDDITNGLKSIATDGIKSLIDGDFSLSSLASKAKQIGQNILTDFAKPFIDAITGQNGIIEMALKPLQTWLNNIASGLTGMGTPSVPGGSGGGGGNSGGSNFPSTGGGAGGFDPWNFGVGLTNLASSIWGNFQNLEIEKSLDDIEEHTRWLKRGLVELPGSAWDQLKWIKDAVKDGLAYVPGRLLDIRNNTDLLKDINAALAPVNGDSIAQWCKSTAGRVAETRDAIYSLRSAITEGNGKLDNLSPSITINITVNGQTTSQTVNLSQAAAWNFSV